MMVCMSDGLRTRLSFDIFRSFFHPGRQDNYGLNYGHRVRIEIASSGLLMFVATVAWNNACLTVLRLTEPDAALAAYRMCTLPISLARRRFQGGALNDNSSRDHTNHEALLSGSVAKLHHHLHRNPLDTTHFLCFCLGLVKRPGAEICRKFFCPQKATKSYCPNSEFVVIDIGE